MRHRNITVIGKRKKNAAILIMNAHEAINVLQTWIIFSQIHIYPISELGHVDY